MKSLFQFERYLFKSEFLFDGLQKETVKLLYTNQKIINYEKGQIIFHEGTQPTGIHYILKGKVKKYASGHDGRQHIFYLCHEKELLGYHALLCNEPYPDSAAVLENSEIAFIPAKDFLLAIEQSHLLSQKLLQNLSHEFGVFINSTRILAQYSVRERTAITLLVLNEKYKMHQPKNMTVEINLSRNDLASIVGTVKETLVRILHDFKEEGIIESRGRSILIKNPKALEKISSHY